MSDFIEKSLAILGKLGKLKLHLKIIKIKCGNSCRFYCGYLVKYPI